MVYSEDHFALLRSHYEDVWKNKGLLRRWSEGPTWELPDGFGVLEFAPSEERKMWSYATVGMSQLTDPRKVELHVFSRVQEDSLVELMTVTAHYHRTGNPLDLGHTVHFGRTWMPGSLCDHGLVSLPYLDGPPLENCEIVKGDPVKCFWLIPITLQELEYKQRFGLDALEQAFERSQFDYADPHRASVV